MIGFDIPDVDPIAIMPASLVVLLLFLNIYEIMDGDALLASETRWIVALYLAGLGALGVDRLMVRLIQVHYSHRELAAFVNLVAMLWGIWTGFRWGACTRR